MQPDDQKSAYVREWLRKAQEDLTSAERLLRPPPLIYSAAFHCQQAAEKALKAFLTWHDQQFPWTHNLERLVRYCAQIDTDFNTLMDDAELLTPYATLPRYPTAGIELTEEMTSAAYRSAIEVVDFVRARLPEEVLPTD